jgi:hypothetical protein
LRGWEQKFAGQAIELGKLEIPTDAVHTSTIDGVNIVYKPKFSIPQGLGDFTGPILVAAWPCPVMTDQGLCLRYLWDGEPMTLVISFKPKRPGKNSGPFTRTGWGGFFIVEPNLAAAAVGPFDPRDILNAWPYATAFLNKNKK